MSTAPICLRTHWDPSMVSRHVLPQFPHAPQLAFDPRPATKICTSYYTTSAGDGPLLQEASAPILGSVPEALLGGPKRATDKSPSSVYPPGGAARVNFPYSPYANHVGLESDLLRLQEPLTRCKEKRFQGPPAANMASNAWDSDSSSDDEDKYASVSKKMRKAGCREADDALAAARSGRLFMNPTRYDRTTTPPKNAAQE